MPVPSGTGMQKLPRSGCRRGPLGRISKE